MKCNISITIALLLPFLFLASCKEKSSSPPAPDLIKSINLKRGNPVSCGPAGNEFGTVEFDMSCDNKVKEDFNLGMEMLHSFEYDEAEKVFAKVIDNFPGCAMAYWGVAMSNFHPLWTPPTEEELKKGSKAIEIAKSIINKTKRESDYINAIDAFYKDRESKNHITRCQDFSKAMGKLYSDYPDDKEAAIFYALSLDAAASPTDKSYANQKKAGEILNALYPSGPNHPGIVHYIIHTYDYPGLATMALSAAQNYAAVAPASAHALHMPSHIFTRLGYWGESINSNLASIAAAKCYAEQAGLTGHYDEEIHGLDYLVYAYLQKGDNDSAISLLHYLETDLKGFPANFKVAYAYAAIPSRIVLENKNWKAAANLLVKPVNFPWKDFPWPEGIIHFTRGLGALHIGDKVAAENELQKLQELQTVLEKQKDAYKSKQLEVQAKSIQAWLLFKNNRNDDAIALMRKAADMEDSSGKHPVTPGEVIPARELLADLLMEMNKPSEALLEYEKALQKTPNKKNLLKGAALAAAKIN